MVTMRYGFVSAARTVHMTRLMPATRVVWSTVRRVVGVDSDYVLVDMITMRVMQMTIMQIICMAVMLHRGVRSQVHVCDRDSGESQFMAMLLISSCVLCVSESEVQQLDYMLIR